MLFQEELFNDTHKLKNWLNGTARDTYVKIDIPYLFKQYIVRVPLLMTPKVQESNLNINIITWWVHMQMPPYSWILIFLIDFLCSCLSISVEGTEWDCFVLNQSTRLQASNFSTNECFQFKFKNNLAVLNWFIWFHVKCYLLFIAKL